MKRLVVSSLLGLLFLSGMIHSEDRKPSSSNWHVLCKKYLPPMIVAGLIGGGTGYTTRYIEKELKLTNTPEDKVIMIVLWLIESLVRSGIIASIEKDFIDCNIPYKKHVMPLTAWISSWLVYLNR